MDKSLVRFNIVMSGIVIAYIFLIFLNFFVSNRENALIVWMLILLILWRNGKVLTKTNYVSFSPNLLKKQENKKRFNVLFYTWMFFILILIYIVNFMTKETSILLKTHKGYIQLLGFIFLLFVIYMAQKNIRISKKKKQEILNPKN